MKDKSQLLLLSVSLNVCLIVTFFYFAFREKEIPEHLEKTAVMIEKMPLPSQDKVLEELRSYGFTHLLTLLEDKELIENGYARRDLALSLLVSLHHFNLEKALDASTSQKRVYRDLILFPGLTDYHFAAIIRFAKTEKWPLTPYGQFLQIQKTIPFVDPTLIDAFTCTPEFQAVQTLFLKSGMEVTPFNLISLLAEGPWKLIEEFTADQKIVVDLTPLRRRKFLLEYLKEKSVLSARILVEVDYEFAATRLSDEQIAEVLTTYPEKNPFLQRFAKIVLTSPRSDAVWQKTQATLGVQAPLKAVAQNELRNKKTHVVEKGESLWILSRRYHVSIEHLVEINQLESDRLRLGQKLIIEN